MSTLRSTILAASLSVLAAAPALADRTDDREAINALMWHYARALDTANPDAYAAVYTEDGQFGVGENATKGRAALREMIANFKARRDAAENPAPQLYHMNADTWIEFVDDTHARHHSYWLTLAAASGDTPTRVLAAGVGVDELVKVNGEWLIKVRNVTADE
jgi:3-phenylpropionate/cinnamic acid dioxygenase small subunit